MSSLLQGKSGLVVGVANKRSIAYSVAEALHSHGAKLGFTYQNERLKDKIVPLVEGMTDLPCQECDATNELQLTDVMNFFGNKWGKIDFIIHAIAFAKPDELEGEFIKASREGFLLAMDVSAYTLVSMARAARPWLKKAGQGSVVTLTYYGGEKVVQNYNTMGVAKSALDMSMRYLANDLGPEGIRVNAISPGPIQTLAARGIRNFTLMLKHAADKAPMKRNVSAAEVGNTAVYLCSDLSQGVTGELIHVDAGYHITA